MRPDRKELLDEIGFAWNAESQWNQQYEWQDSKWKKRYEKLIELKRKNGHCLVPKNYEQDKSLVQ
jgi:hypothetical protein